jgi:hypothetical protein
MTMRNRKTVITAFVLVAVMLMAVGFAALTDNLIIEGEANVGTTAAQSAFEDDIYFVSAVQHSTSVLPEVVATRTANEAAVGQTNNDSVTYKVKGLALKGESVTFKFTVKNDSTEFDAKISIDEGYPTNTNSKAFKVEYFYGSETNASVANAVVPSGGTYDIYVKVTLISEPQENLSGAFVLNLTATSQAKAATGN